MAGTVTWQVLPVHSSVNPAIIRGEVTASVRQYCAGIAGMPGSRAGCQAQAVHGQSRAGSRTAKITDTENRRQSGRVGGFGVLQFDNVNLVRLRKRSLYRKDVALSYDEERKRGEERKETKGRRETDGMGDDRKMLAIWRLRWPTRARRRDDSGGSSFLSSFLARCPQQRRGRGRRGRQRDEDGEKKGHGHGHAQAHLASATTTTKTITDVPDRVRPRYLSPANSLNE
ncbi:hypothetical protein SCHPADRAFT_897114 [Schizopora paradoxa]|uniref:Uncharacterized protein n=1 Tax=Schizopora paradoxa TaxID=27342 RepID=A0A0H2R4B9_9AGAM|nr:hypothetical protein SCHPADRAFT_897114 [Schizopora paradoxa]